MGTVERDDVAASYVLRPCFALVIKTVMTRTDEVFGSHRVERGENDLGGFVCAVDRDGAPGSGVGEVSRWLAGGGQRRRRMSP